MTAGVGVRFPSQERTVTADDAPTEALAKVCLFVDEDFGRDHVSERHEHLQYVLVSELLGQVVDEQVGTFGTWRARWEAGMRSEWISRSETAGGRVPYCRQRTTQDNIT